MTNKIGPSFSDEITAAGLAGLPFSWDPISGEITYGEAITDGQMNQIAGVLQAHDPTKPSAYQQKAAARAALAESDITMLRIQEAVAATRTQWSATDVQAWITYRGELRTVAGSGGALPARPAYPANT